MKDIIHFLHVKNYNYFKLIIQKQYSYRPLFAPSGATASFRNYSKTVEKKVEIINSYQNIRAYKNKHWDLNIGHL